MIIIDVSVSKCGIVNRNEFYVSDISMEEQECQMSNTNASEENVESPSTYGNEAYKQHRIQEKKRQYQREEEYSSESDDVKLPET